LLGDIPELHDFEFRHHELGDGNDQLSSLGTISFSTADGKIYRFIT